ncbi:11950_t:CDS:1, partial [Diversispora eburnea]
LEVLSARATSYLFLWRGFDSVGTILLLLWRGFGPDGTSLLLLWRGFGPVGTVLLLLWRGFGPVGTVLSAVGGFTPVGICETFTEMDPCLLLKLTGD